MSSIEELTRELEEVRRREDAVAEILRVMTRSGMRLQPILDQIVTAAVTLCNSESVFLYLVEGELLHMRANFGQPQEVVEYERVHPDRPGMGSCSGRVALTKRPVHIPDIHADPDYEYPAIDIKTVLGIPVMVDGELRGVIGAGRNEVRPFTEAEIQLMATFADESAVAIANAQLFETVERQKTELARFLSPEVAALISSDEGERLLAGHRAYVTVAYFDLRGFTAFASTAEPEELMEVIREYHGAVGELVSEHAGTLEHFAGDGLMVFFNDPVPLEDHELHAARLAVGLHDRVGELAVGWKKRGHDLGLGAGIASGYATLGRVGFEGRYDYAVLGTVSNLAARLSDAAGPGQILLNQRTHAALEDRIDARPLAELDLKGFSAPVPTFELVGLNARAGRAPGAS